MDDANRTTRRRQQREHAVRMTLVPNFPEIVRKEEQCRLCSLVEGDPDLLLYIHTQWKNGMGVRALETATAETWDERKETRLDHRCFDRHFRGPKRHVDFSEITTAVGEVLADSSEDIIELAPNPSSKDEGVLPPMPPPAVEKVEPRPEDLEAGAGDYFDMQSVINRLRARMTQIDETTSFVDRDGRVNSYGIVIWLRLVSEMRQALEALNRMRNTDRLTKAILQAHTKRFAQLLSVPLVQGFEQLLIAMRERGASPAALAEIERFAREEVQQIVIHAAEESVKESCSAYRLH